MLKQHDVPHVSYYSKLVLQVDYNVATQHEEQEMDKRILDSISAHGLNGFDKRRFDSIADSRGFSGRKLRILNFSLKLGMHLNNKFLIVPFPNCNLR
jgi:hypothetical protein